MSKSEGWLIFLSTERVHDPKQQSEREAYEDARDNREIKTAMSALVADVAGKTSQTKRQLCAEAQKETGGDQYNAEYEQYAADFAQRVHTRLL
jgi:hypothetical protein